MWILGSDLFHSMGFRQVISRFILSQESENISYTTSTKRDYGISMNYLNTEIAF